MSRDGTLPPGVEHGDPDAPWNQPDAEETVCVCCQGLNYDERTCPGCSSPICDACARALEDENRECAGCAADSAWDARYQARLAPSLSCATRRPETEEPL